VSVWYTVSAWVLTIIDLVASGVVVGVPTTEVGVDGSSKPVRTNGEGSVYRYVGTGVPIVPVPWKPSGNPVFACSLGGDMRLAPGW